MPIENYLTELKDDGKPLVSSGLANLSSLSPNELVLFLDAWPVIGVGRRRDILDKLVEMADENPSLNFDDIFLACLKDPDESVRVSAIEGLWEYENRSLIGLLLDMLRGDSHQSVRAAAATALGKFTLLAELGELPPDDSAKLEEELVAVIADGTEQLEVRRRAVEAIAALSVPRVTEIIRGAYNSDEGKMKVSAIYAMGVNCDPAWLAILITELGNLDAEVRFEAVGACGELGEEEAVPHIVSLLSDPDAQVQLSAIAALGKIGGSEAEDALRMCQDHADEHIIEAVGEAMEDLERERDPFSFGVE